MLETDSLRKILHGKAIIATQAVSLPCRIGEEPFVVPTNGTIYGEFWFRTGDGSQMELGSKKSFEMTVGLLQFTLYAPEKSGDGPILKIGDQLKNMLNRGQWQVPPDGYVNVGVVACQQLPGVSSSGHKVVIVDGSFKYYHKNSAPSSLLDD